MKIDPESGLGPSRRGDLTREGDKFVIQNRYLQFRFDKSYKENQSHGTDNIIRNRYPYRIEG